MYFIYNLFLHILILIGLPFILLDLLFRSRHRKGFFQKLGFLPKGLKKDLRGCLWVHGVSVGEVNSVLPMLASLKEKYPKKKLLLSVTTATGYSFAKLKSKEMDQVIYFPFDLPWICGRVIRQIKPKLVIIAEKEIWPNFLHALKKNQVHVMWVNGRVSEKSSRWYGKFKGFFREMLSGVDLIAVDSESNLRRWVQIGAHPDRVVVTGHTKADQAFTNFSGSQPAIPFPLQSLIDKRNVFLAASTHEGEEEILCNVFRRISSSRPDLFFILAPRRPERFDRVAHLLTKKKILYRSFTSLESGEDASRVEALLIDQLGVLASLFSIATVAFIGGSLVPVGGHNIWEPLVFGVPIIYGPYMDQDYDLAKQGGSIQVSNPEELQSQLAQLLDSKLKRQDFQEKMKTFLEAHRGAVKKNVQLAESISS